MEEKIKRTIYISSIDLKVRFMQAEGSVGACHHATAQSQFPLFCCR